VQAQRLQSDTMFGLDNPDLPRLDRILNDAMFPFTKLPHAELRARIGERIRLAAPGDPSEVRRSHIAIRRSSNLIDAVQVIGTIRPDGPPWNARPAHSFVKRANGWWSGTVYEGDQPGCRIRLPGDPERPRAEVYLPIPGWKRVIGTLSLTQAAIGMGIVVVAAAVMITIAVVRSLG
jgi:hypothetical protein